MKKKILIIDDDPGIQEIFKIIFVKAGFEVQIIDARQVLEGKYTQPDIYLIDRQLSGIDGLNICAHLKKNAKTKDIPVIMVSASPDIAKLSVAAGANGFVEKPFNISDLVNVINNNLEKVPLN